MEKPCRINSNRKPKISHKIFLKQNWLKFEDQVLLWFSIETAVYSYNQVSGLKRYEEFHSKLNEFHSKLNSCIALASQSAIWQQLPKTWASTVKTKNINITVLNIKLALDYYFSEYKSLIITTVVFKTNLKISK